MARELKWEIKEPVPQAPVWRAVRRETLRKGSPAEWAVTEHLTSTDVLWVVPMPVYNVQDEGRVVVTITVNPAGQVISTSINKRTNTVNASLRKAAEEAARKARFNQVDGVNNQTGTITYYFKLK